jgi:hypothetical protein
VKVKAWHDKKKKPVMDYFHLFRKFPQAIRIVHSFCTIATHFVVAIQLELKQSAISACVRCFQPATIAAGLAVKRWFPRVNCREGSPEALWRILETRALRPPQK